MSITTLMKLEQAERMLAEITTVEDAANLVDFAEAARVYAKQAKLGTGAINSATAIKLKAERRLAITVDEGQANGQIATQKDGRTHLGIRSANTQTLPVETVELPAPKTLAELGVNARKVNEARAIRDEYTDADIDELVDTATAKDQTVARSEVVQSAKRKKKRAERDIRDAELETKPVDMTTLAKFPILYVDPPWRYDFSATSNRDIENQYPTMSHDDLCALTIPTADDAVLLMWVTNPKLVEGLEVMKAWGFQYKTNMVWVKDKIGMGYYARSRHELLLIGRKGKGPIPDDDRRPDSVVTATRGQHSAKPAELYDLIDAMYPHLPKVEMFARSTREGWASWGNQV